MSSSGLDQPDILEAVYYSHAVPRNPEVLTNLGLIFDRLYFPGVYMPPPGFDRKAVEKEIQRIISHFQGRLDPNTRQLLDCMSFALHYKDVAEFCIFPGKTDRLEQFECLVHDVVNQLELMVFGPRPEGEIPVQHGGPWVKGLAGDDPMLHQLRAPDTIYYPANALVFAAQRNLPLINDLEWLPVPGIPVDPKANAKLLATILTMESVSLVLPRLKPLQPTALRDFREELAPHIKPFRVAMLKLSKELNVAIQAGAPLGEVQKQARFLVQTDVYPKLAELDAVIQNPHKHWYRRAVDLAKAAPELAANFATLPVGHAVAKLLMKIAGVLADVRDEQLSREKLVASTGLYYLLKLKAAAREPSAANTVR
jgi:hypothetical protein